MKKTYSFRKFINDLHLWLGLPSALVLVVMCLTGTLYVFQREITQWVDSEKFHVAVPANEKRLSIITLTSSVEKAKGGKVTQIQIAQELDEAWTFTVTPPEPPTERDGNKGERINLQKELSDKKQDKSKKEAGEKDKVKSYLVNPYSGAIQGDAKTPSVQFFAKVLQLHRWLLIENKDIGGAITGTACLMMLFLQITGLILWAPAKLKSWKKWAAWDAGFKVKMDGSFKRMNFDLHKTFGFYAFFFVTIMALTGPYFAFKWYKAGALTLLNTKPISKENTIQSESGNHTILSLDEIVVQVNKLYPYKGNTRITFPKDVTGSYAIQKYQNGFLTSSGVDRVTLDQYTGKVLDLQRYSDRTLAEKMVSSVKAIHTGEIFGTFTKVLYFIACLLATSLPVTGFYIWLGKGKKGKKKGDIKTSKHKPVRVERVREKVATDV